MYKDLLRKSTAIVLLIKPFVRQCSSSVSIVCRGKLRNVLIIKLFDCWRSRFVAVVF